MQFFIDVLPSDYSFGFGKIIIIFIIVGHMALNIFKISVEN